MAAYCGRRKKTSETSDRYSHGWLLYVVVIVCSVPCLCACSWCALNVKCVCVVFDLHCAVVEALCVLCVCEQCGV